MLKIFCICSVFIQLSALSSEISQFCLRWRCEQLDSWFVGFRLHPAISMCPVSPAKLLSLNTARPTNHLQHKISAKSLYYAPSLDRARFQLGIIGHSISLGCRTRLCCGTLPTSHPSRIGRYSRFVSPHSLVLNRSSSKDCSGMYQDSEFSPSASYVPLYSLPVRT